MKAPFHPLALALALSSACVDFGVDATTVEDPEVVAVVVACDTGDCGAVVEMASLKFVQLEVVIPVGGSVTWVNHDTAFHIIAEGEPGGAEPEWISPSILFGETWSYVFTEPGEHVYYCDNHERTMKDATVIVEE